MISYKDVTDQEITETLAKIEEIKNTTRPNIDGRMLWCVVNLIFSAGVKASQIPWFKVKEVFTGTDILSSIFTCWDKPIKPIPLSDRIKGILMEYIQYLQGNRPQLDPDSPLFPDYSEKYAKRALTKDLKDFSLQFNQLRRIGAGNYYWTLVRSGRNPDTAEKETAIQFRDKEDGGSRTTFQSSPQSQIGERLRRERREHKKEEQTVKRAEKRKPRKIRISAKGIMGHEEARQKNLSVDYFQGTIDGVNLTTNRVDASSESSGPGRTMAFKVDGATKITKVDRIRVIGEEPGTKDVKSQASLSDLKQGMSVSITYTKGGFDLAKRITVLGSYQTWLKSGNSMKQLSGTEMVQHLKSLLKKRKDPKTP